MEKKPNIILITVDSLRANHLGFMGYEKDTSRNLDKLANESAVFTQAYANGPNSSHSSPSILTATYPLDFQTLRIERPRVLLSEALKDQGYLTACFQTSPIISRFYGYDKGWDYFEDIAIPLPRSKYFNPYSFKGKMQDILIKLSVNVNPHIFFILLYLRNRIRGLFQKVRPYKTGAPMVNKLLEEFISANKDSEKPFFAWAHYQDAHGPFIPYDCHYKERQLTYSEIIGRNLPTLIANHPSKNKSFRRFSEKHINKTIGFYDDGIKYFDDQFGGFLEFLKKENIENTIICITSDHGDEFLEHGGVGHHEQKLYNELLHIPLIIKVPGISPQRIERKVSLIDLSSTLCDLAGVEKPASYKGNNLFEGSDGIIFHQVSLPDIKNFWDKLELKNLSRCVLALQSDGWKYIIDYLDGKEELYYLKDDGKEQNNLIEKDTKAATLMREEIKGFLARNPILSLTK
jgi:arylsulfatase A-like enzyme